MPVIPMTETKAHRGVMHLLVILFGIGAWIAINGIWVELPILVDRLPEGWSLPSFLVILSQVANIGPLIVGIMQACSPKYYHQNALIYIMLAFGTSSCFLLIFFWSETAMMLGEEHSIALFVLFLVVSFVDCTSSVTFIPYMTRFQTVFLSTYFIGEGLSGFLPSIFALIQGVSETYCKNVTEVNQTTNETYYKLVAQYKDPRFSVEVFFGFLCFMMALCSTAFIALNHLKLTQAFVNRNSDEISDEMKSTSTELSTLSSGSKGEYSSGCEVTGTTDELVMVERSGKLTFDHYVYFYTVVFWTSCLSNGVMPSVVSYSSLPYGQLPYHFAATLGAMANPVACLIAMFLPVKSRTVVGIFVAIMTGFGAYLMALAVESPCPILIESSAGAILMVLSQIFFVFAASYAKVSVGQILRVRGGTKSLVWYGAFTQLGALVGACVMFPLVNVYYLFTPGDECTTVCM